MQLDNLRAVQLCAARCAPFVAHNRPAHKLRLMAALDEKTNPEMCMDTVRLAKPEDYTALKEWDEFWGDRRQEMQRGELLVFDAESVGVVGYLLLSRNTFLNYPFISIVCVKDTHRRIGVGSSLLQKANSILGGGRHFTSTEPQNSAAKSLFESVGFKCVGELSHVNFDKSAELFYVREA